MSISNRFLLIVLSSLGLISYSSAQSFSFSTPADLVVCNTVEFGIQIENNTAGPLENLTVLAELPGGLEYVLGSVISGTECGVTNLNNPTFCVSDLAPGATVNLRYQVFLPCEVLVGVNNGITFNTDYTFCQGPANCQSVSSDDFVVETPLLVLSRSTNTYFEGSRGDVLVRELTIRNTRLGALTDFTFSDRHTGCVDLSVNIGTVVSPDYYNFEVEFGAADFATIGDGDGLFEFNEEIVLQERVEITCCGVDTLSSLSNIRFNWGCGGETCQDPVPGVNAFIQVLPNEREPNLVTIPDAQLYACVPSDVPVQQSLVVYNNGFEAAANIALELRAPNGNFPGLGIDSTSIRVELNGNPTVFDVPQFIRPQGARSCSGDLAFFAEITLPELAVNDTLTFYFDLIACPETDCPNESVDWYYRVNYDQECGSFGGDRVEGTASAVDENEVLIGTVGNAGFSNGAFTEVAVSGFVMPTSSPYDSLRFSIVLPCGITFEFGDFAINGTEPTTTIIDDSDPESTRIELVYGGFSPTDSFEMAPFTTSFDCAAYFDCVGADCTDSLLTSCPAPYGCAVTPQLAQSISVVMNLDGLNDCAAGTATDYCSINRVNVNCPTTICEIPTQGYIVSSLSLLRSNTGLADNNDDGIAEPGAAIDESLIRRDRAMDGDTLQEIIRAQVILENGTTDIAHAFIEETYSTNFLVTLPADFRSAFQVLNTTVEVLDASSGVRYTSPLQAEFGIQNEYRYRLGASTLSELPTGFRFQNGDSIIFRKSIYLAERRLQTTSFATNATGRTDFLQSTVEMWINDSPTFVATIPPVRCGCRVKSVQITPIAYTITPGIFPLEICVESTYRGASFLNVELFEGNFFPFEFRPIAFPQNWIVTVPEEVSIDCAQLGVLRKQLGTPLLTDVPLAVQKIGDTHHIGLADVFDPLIDEGYNLTVQYCLASDADCSFSGANSIELEVPIEFLGSIPADPNPAILTPTSVGLRTLTPNLIPVVDLPDVISLTDRATWDIELTNVRTVLSTFRSEAAPNAWAVVESATGLVSDFTLINTVTGTPYPQNNGIFQLGDILPSDTLLLQLGARSASCANEMLMLRIGWNCDPYLEPSQKPCYEVEVPLQFRSSLGQIEMISNSPTGPFNLCDTIGPFELRIFNADLGYVFEVGLDALLPEGMTVLPGTSTIEYPIGGTAVAISDPTILPTGRYFWSLSDQVIPIDTAGLNGVNESPLNELVLRYFAITECETFASGSVVNYLGEAFQNCDELANRVRRVSDAITIAGVTTPYSAAFDIEIPETIGCVDTAIITVGGSADGVLMNGDSLVILLPEGISYAPASYVACGPAPLNPPIIEQQGDQQRLRFALPEGVAANTDLCFQFLTQGWLALDCQNLRITAEATAPSSALCVATGGDCDIKVVTGRDDDFITIERPELILADLTLAVTGTAAPLSGNVTVQLENTSNVDFLGGGRVLLFIDTNGNGVQDGSEISLGQIDLTTAILGGATFTGNANITLDPSQLCGLTAALSADACVCALPAAVTTSQITWNNTTEYTVCSDTALPIGFPANAGAAYQWAPVTDLSCSTCPDPDFLSANLSPDPMFVDLSLEEAFANGCTIEHNYTVRINPQGRILAAQSPLCLGESTTLFATSGTSYVWTGPGVVQNEQSQLVTPTAATTYTVNVTDADGCQGSDTVTIIVETPPVVELQQDTISVCGTDPVTVATVFQTGVQYAWSPVGAVLDPTFNSTIVTATDDVLLTLTVRDNDSGCESSDQVFVDFGATVDVAVDPDFTICLGESRSITASGALTYEWMPSAGLNCDTCATVIASPLQTTTYSVLGTDLDGCSGVAEVMVTVVTDTIEVDGPVVNLCAGESVELFGDIITEPGRYCDFFPDPSSCDSLYCVDVFVFEAPDTILVEEILCPGTPVEFYGQTFDESGFYCVFLPGDICDSTACLSLNYFTAVPPMIEPGDTSVLLGQEVIITIDGDYTNLVWTPTDFLDPDRGAFVTASPTETTTFTVSGLDPLGCPVTSSLTITVGNSCFPDSIDIPMAFSPNGDGLNETFKVMKSEVNSAEIELEVWSRWGQKVFSGEGRDPEWDGTFEDKAMPADVYAFLIRIACPDGSGMETYKGEVTLFR